MRQLHLEVLDFEDAARWRLTTELGAFLAHHSVDHQWPASGPRILPNTDGASKPGGQAIELSRLTGAEPWLFDKDCVVADRPGLAPGRRGTGSASGCS
jgi:hypothetical protein